MRHVTIVEKGLKMTILQNFMFFRRVPSPDEDTQDFKSFKRSDQRLKFKRSSTTFFLPKSKN
ncbi:hypothetical protein BpHYR1_027383 [Brachionus plicatilis]|uniref:Uncharacterized protein n=1 Tax=Brachionus plicatilis TaxID=10195 RepID=A0A3M7RNJ0_BRAPC|nr:hypothetical protein BpHYR1_027383 [Brachionus plicatilis]